MPALIIAQGSADSLHARGTFPAQALSHVHALPHLLTQTLKFHEAAIDCGNIQAFYERDLRFHMRICEKSGNRYAAQTLHRLIVSLFAFVVIRLHARRDDPQFWERSIEQHRQMLAAIKTGDQNFAEQQVRHSIAQFASATAGLMPVKQLHPRRFE